MLGWQYYKENGQGPAVVFNPVPVAYGVGLEKLHETESLPTDDCCFNALQTLLLLSLCNLCCDCEKFT